MRHIETCMEIHLLDAGVEFSRSPRSSSKVVVDRRTRTSGGRPGLGNSGGFLVFWLVDDREHVHLPERARAPQWHVGRTLSTHSGGTAVDWHHLPWNLRRYGGISGIESKRRRDDSHDAFRRPRIARYRSGRAAPFGEARGGGAAKGTWGGTPARKPVDGVPALFEHRAERGARAPRDPARAFVRGRRDACTRAHRSVGDARSGADILTRRARIRPEPSRPPRRPVTGARDGFRHDAPERANPGDLQWRDRAGLRPASPFTIARRRKDGREATEVGRAMQASRGDHTIRHARRVPPTRPLVRENNRTGRRARDHQ